MTKEQGEALIKYVEEAVAHLRTEQLVGTSTAAIVTYDAIKAADVCRLEALAAFRALLP